VVKEEPLTPEQEAYIANEEIVHERFPGSEDPEDVSKEKVELTPEQRAEIEHEYTEGY